VSRVALAYHVCMRTLLALGSFVLLLALLAPEARSSQRFDCQDVRQRLDAARDESRAFDRTASRDLQRERKDLQQDLRTETRGPKQLANRNRALNRNLASWRTELEILARRTAEADAKADQLEASGDTKGARRERNRADGARRQRARMEARIAEAEQEIAANEAEIQAIESDEKTAASLQSRRAEVDRELAGERGRRRELQREVAFWNWLLDLCRERAGGAGD
jgi:chromosome segregation ATPase